MGFYYISILSVIPLGIAWGILALIFWGIARSTRDIRRRGLVLSIVGVVFFLLPISEELWIAWNFGQACKEAGTFIYKKVQVDGYYNDTGTVTRIVGGPAYKFIESRDRDGGYRRVERATDEEKARAIAWYEGSHAGKRPPPNDWIIQPIQNRIQVVVEMSTGYAWRVTKLDRPTARYHYRDTTPMNGNSWAHKVGKTESVVIDTESGAVIARYTAFGRRPPWFFVGLDVPAYACDAPGRWPFARGNSLIYRDALIPAGQR